MMDAHYVGCHNIMTRVLCQRQDHYLSQVAMPSHRFSEGAILMARHPWGSFNRKLGQRVDSRGSAWQLNRERRPLPYCTLDLDPPAVGLHQLPGDGQP
jgi:hypothetical protein